MCCRALETRLGLILIDLTLIHFIHLYHWLNQVVAVAAVLLVLNLCFSMRTPHLSAARRLKKNKSVFYWWIPTWETRGGQTGPCLDKHKDALGPSWGKATVHLHICLVPEVDCLSFLFLGKIPGSKVGVKLILEAIPMLVSQELYLNLFPFSCPQKLIPAVCQACWHLQTAFQK